MEEVTLLGLAKFPANAPPGSGFAMCTRKGRVFIMHSESPERGQEWIKAIRSVGANIRASSDTTLELKKKGGCWLAAIMVTSAPFRSNNTPPPPDPQSCSKFC